VKRLSGGCVPVFPRIQYSVCISSYINGGAVSVPVLFGPNYFETSGLNDR